MKERWRDGFSKDCPICENPNLPYYGKVYPSNDLFLSYNCEFCGNEYTRRDEAPEILVERWPSPGRPKGESDA